jgi:DNA-binding CsgD family transcriptional regulator
VDHQYPLVTQEDYLHVVRLVAEIAVAEDTPTRWATLMGGIRDLVRGQTVMAGLGRVFDMQLEFESGTMRKLGGADDAYFRRIIESGKCRKHPMIEPGLRRFASEPWLVVRREDFFDDHEWYSFPFVQTVVRALDMGPTIYAASRIHPDRSLFLAVSRPWDDKCRFDARDAQCVDLLMEVGYRLATLFHARGVQESDLSTRLQQTLRGLLAGRSEKEIAHELGVSIATVHHYVSELYRRFNVHSGRELMAILLGHQHQPDKE